MMILVCPELLRVKLIVAELLKGLGSKKILEVEKLPVTPSVTASMISI
jgi:hypothetical protein